MLIPMEIYSYFDFPGGSGCAADLWVHPWTDRLIPYYKNLVLNKEIWTDLLFIQTHLAYIANAKKLCYMKQQSNRFESVRKAPVLTSIATAK